MIKWALFQACKDFSIYANQSMWLHHINKLKAKTHMVISIDAEKDFDKIQHPFIIKTAESRHERKLPQHNKGHLWETHSKHYSQWWKTESIFSEVRNKTRVPTLSTIIQYNFGSPGHINQRRKRKEIQIGKEDIKLSLFTGNMTLYIENPKDTTRKLLELIHEYSKVAG